MGKPFEIGYLDKQAQTATVYSTNYLRLDEYLEELTIQLKEKTFKGNVMFDLLLSNGMSTNRFVELVFDGQEFDKKSFKIIKANTEIINNSFDFYNEHTNLLDNGILTKPQKFQVKKRFVPSY